MHHSACNLHPHRSGFTLIELSIVLVIIGLIIGGVLVGRDLIEAAKIRSQINQIEKYNQAINAFRLKYDDLPGDMSSVKAAQLDFESRGAAPDGPTYHGDGNGRIFSGASNAQGTAAGETVLLWNDLSKANLIEGSFQGTDCNPSYTNCTVASASLPSSSIVPAAKIGNNTYIGVLEPNGSREFVPNF